MSIRGISVGKHLRFFFDLDQGFEFFLGVFVIIGAMKRFEEEIIGQSVLYIPTAEDANFFLLSVFHFFR